MVRVFRKPTVFAWLTTRLQWWFQGWIAEAASKPYVYKTCLIASAVKTTVKVGSCFSKKHEFVPMETKKIETFVMQWINYF